MLTHAQARSKGPRRANYSYPTANAVHPHRSWLASIGSMIVTMYKLTRQRRQRQRAIAELRGLDDRALHDIGLLRCEIDSIPRIGPWE